MRLRFRRYQAIPVRTPEESQTLMIVGDAAIATVKVGHGRLIPLIIVDTTNRPDISEVIVMQGHLPAGDVVVQWGELAGRRDHIALILRFERPIEGMAIIEFDIAKQGILVEHILQSNALYIQSGVPGDRLGHDLDRPKMLVEVPDTNFKGKWEKLYFNAIIQRMRNNGLNRKVAKVAAQNYLTKVREIASFRIK
jgi:hypothetical protein